MKSRIAQLSGSAVVRELSTSSADATVHDVRRATDLLRSDVQQRGYSSSPQLPYAFGQAPMLQPIHYAPPPHPTMAPHPAMWPTIQPSPHFQPAPMPTLAWSGPPTYHTGAMPAPVAHGHALAMPFGLYPQHGSPFAPSPRTLPEDSPSGT